MSTSYKPALLKALVRIFRIAPAERLSLTRIGQEFAKMYWNQTVLYHLRQHSTRIKEAEVITAIKRIAARYKVRFYSDLGMDQKDELSVRMARVLKINVLSAFHTSAPTSMGPLFVWEDDVIRVHQDAATFLALEGAALELLANYYWAKFLESRNRLSPKIIEKVEVDGLPRVSMMRYMKILLQDDEPRCFYCERPFSDGGRFAVDHVIPRSFLMDDPFWDLVLACFACNSSKSDILPDHRFIDHLMQRNSFARSLLPTGEVGLLHGCDDIARLYDAAISLEWPRFWSP